MITLKQIAEYVDGQLKGDGNRVIRTLASLEQAESDHLSFLATPDIDRLQSTRAGAVLVDSRHADMAPCPVIVVDDPRLACAKLSKLFVSTDTQSQGIHPTAVISEDAKVDSSCSIGPMVVIESGARLGKQVCVGAGTVIGRDVLIGDGTKIFPKVVIEPSVVIGKDCILYAGCIIGSEGFGYLPNNGLIQKAYHLYAVILEEGVEVGANTTIDRGYLRHTYIGAQTKIDNQVQIGHNVTVGQCTLIAGCVGIAGSAKIGSYCMIGGGCLIKGHINISDHVQLTADTSVMSSIEKPGIYSSCAVMMPYRQWKKSAALFRRLPNLVKQLRMEKP